MVSLVKYALFVEQDNEHHNYLVSPEKSHPGLFSGAEVKTLAQMRGFAGIFASRTGLSAGVCKPSMTCPSTRKMHLALVFWSKKVVKL